MIRLVVLGSSAAMPSPKSVPSSFAIKSGSTFLFDACEGVQRQMMKYGISYSKLKCVFVSHLHADHFLGIFGLVQTMNMQGRKEELIIFGPEGTKETIGKALGIKGLMPNFPVRIEESKRKRKLYSDKLISVSCFPVKHKCKALGFVMEEEPIRKFKEELARSKGISGRLFSEIEEKGFVEINGKRIELDDVTYLKPGKKIVYTGDTIACKEIVKNAKDANLLIHDATFLDSEKDTAKQKWHATAKDAAETAKKANVKSLLLTHFSNRYEKLEPFLEEAKKIFSETAIAEEGKEIMI